MENQRWSDACCLTVRNCMRISWMHWSVIVNVWGMRASILTMRYCSMDWRLNVNRVLRLTWLIAISQRMVVSLSSRILRDTNSIPVIWLPGDLRLTWLLSWWMVVPEWLPRLVAILSWCLCWGSSMWYWLSTRWTWWVSRKSVLTRLWLTIRSLLLH